MNDIVIKNLSKSFGDKSVLNNVNFRIPYGTYVRITGESGIGKTTLLRLLCGLEKPDLGEIIGAERNDIAFLFQEDRLFPTLSAIKNVMTVIKNGSNAEKKARASQLLLDLGLNESDFSLRPNELSGGMCRRVAIARLLAYNKPILLLDEALRGLDGENALRAARVIERESLGKTVIFVTHGEPMTSKAYTVLSL